MFGREGGWGSVSVMGGAGGGGEGWGGGGVPLERIPGGTLFHLLKGP